jgi:RNA polymerase sigma-70 factor (ECF subfamily)
VRGREQIARVIAGSDGSCHGARLSTDEVNGTLASWQWRPTGPDGALEPFALAVYEFGDALISSITTFLGPPVTTLALR